MMIVIANSFTHGNTRVPRMCYDFASAPCYAHDLRRFGPLITPHRRRADVDLVVKQDYLAESED